ncbi:MAG: ABC transporter ATP-binding protein [Geminicoccaceae bacterium]
MKRLLAVEGLTAAYGQAQILFGLDFSVAEGEAVALLGRNGAGKSTTLKALIGLVRRRSGRVIFDGIDISRSASHQIARAGLGYVPEERRIFRGLSVQENLEVGRQAVRQGTPGWSFERLFEIFPNLAGLRHRPAERTSGGEQQKHSIARTLMGNPKMLLLDEPSEGLAPVIVEQMASALVKLKEDGVSVLLSEQNLRFAGAVASRAYVIETGHLRHEGAMADLLDDGRARKRWLSV